MASQKEIDEELWYACAKEDLKQVKILLLCGANPCQAIEKKQWTAIHEAVCENDSTVIPEAVLSSGRVTDINVRTSDGKIGNTPLLSACYNGNVECAKLLVNHGADVTLTNKNGHSVIHQASVCDNVLMVQECLKWNGVNIDDQRGLNKWTPLMFACIVDKLDIVRFLLSAGANIDLRDKNGNTALQLGRKYEEIAECFLKHAETKRQDLPTALGRLSVSTNSETSKNITSIIKRVFPEFGETKIKSIVKTIEETGVNFGKQNCNEQLLLLEPSDFGNVLKPIEARLLLKIFKEEYGQEKQTVVNF